MSSDLSNLTSGLLGAVIGATVTFFGNLHLEKTRAQSAIDAKKSNLKLSLRLELQACIKALDSIKDTMSSQSFYPFRWTAVLKKSIESLDGQRKSFYLFDDAVLQEKMFQLVTDIALFASDVEAMETIWNGVNENPPKRPNGSEISDSKEVNTQIEGIKEQRRLKLVELVDLKRRIGEAIKELE